MSVIGLQIWAEGVKAVTIQWFQEGDPLVSVSTGCLLQYTHTLMDFTPPRTTCHAIIMKQLMRQTVLKLIRFMNGVLVCSTTQGNGNTRFGLPFSSMKFTSITMNVYMQNKTTLTV